MPDASIAGFDASSVLLTQRLDLLPFSLEIVEAFLTSDEARLFAVTGAKFPGGLTPPLMDDHMADWRTMLEANPERPPWRAWLAIDRTLGEAVGSAGGGGSVDEEGCVMVGWAVYPRYEGNGYGTEAARAVLQWMLEQPSVRSVRATVPPANIPSVRVAEKLGMRVVGEATDAEVGRVIVYEISAVSP